VKGEIQMQKRMYLAGAVCLMGLFGLSATTHAAAATTAFGVSSTSGTVSVIAGCRQGRVICHLSGGGNMTFTLSGTYTSDMTFDFSHAVKNGTGYCNVAVSGSGGMILSDVAGSELDASVAAGTTVCTNQTSEQISAANVPLTLNGASGIFAGTTGSGTAAGTWVPLTASMTLTVGGTYGPTAFTMASTSGTVSVVSGCRQGNKICHLSGGGNLTFSLSGTYTTDVTFDFANAVKNGTGFCNVAVTGTGTLVLSDASGSELDAAVPTGTTGCTVQGGGQISMSNIPLTLSGAAGIFTGSVGSASANGTWFPEAKSMSLTANGSYGPSGT
jgi:hypothetical protein